MDYTFDRDRAATLSDKSALQPEGNNHSSYVKEPSSPVILKFISQDIDGLLPILAHE